MQPLAEDYIYIVGIGHFKKQSVLNERCIDYLFLYNYTISIFSQFPVESMKNFIKHT